MQISKIVVQHLPHLAHPPSTPKLTQIGSLGGSLRDPPVNPYIQLFVHLPRLATANGGASLCFPVWLVKLSSIVSKL